MNTTCQSCQSHRPLDIAEAEIDALRRAVEEAEKDKANIDLLFFGQSFMKDGKHIPLSNVIVDRGAWADVLNATEWVGLTDKEKSSVRDSVSFNQFMTTGEYAMKVQDATESKLKEKNT